MKASGNFMRTLTVLLVLVGNATTAAGSDHFGGPKLASEASVSVRTERYPRLPYSSATYYIYEQAGQTICTKLEVCSKYNQCSTKFSKGAYKDPVDAAIGKAYGETPTAIISRSKWSRHACLRKFLLTNSN
jgi:hypothetical protein